MTIAFSVHGQVSRGIAFLTMVVAAALVRDAHADDPPWLWVNVDAGLSQTQNVGGGFGLIQETETELRIHLTSTNGTIKKSELVEWHPWHWWEQVDGSQTDWRVTGVGPNDEFWCVIKCEMEYPPDGSGPAIRWMSVSDIDFDADTDNNCPDRHRPPTECDDEDYQEYPGVVTGGVIGLVIPINDNNEVNWDMRDAGQPMDRDSDTDVLDCVLKVNPKKGGEWSVLCLADDGTIEVVYTEDGTKAQFADRQLDKDEDNPLNLRIESASYGGGTTGTSGELRAEFDPEEPSAYGWAEDTMRYLLLGCDIDVDSDNDGGIEGQNGWNSGEDFLEAHPVDDDAYQYHPEWKYGMVVAVNDDDNDGDGNPDNGWDGADWDGPNGSTIEQGNDVADLKPGILWGLNLDYSEYTILDSMNAHLYIKKVGGDGAVRLFTTEGHFHIGTFDDNVEVQEFGGQSLFGRLYASHLDILVEGLWPGEVDLSYELFVNGTRVHYDEVRITVVRIDVSATDLDGTVSELEEETVGAYVHWNLDNDDASDNASGSPKRPGGDYLQTGASKVTGEDDLKKVVISLEPTLDVGTVKLAISDANAKLWKDHEKGSDNLVLEGPGELTWDLGESDERSELLSLCSNLWAEGIAAGTCTISLTYTPAPDGECIADYVGYTFVAADCGRQPKTSATPNERTAYGTALPGLVHCEWSITAEKSTVYNCIAWSVGETGEFYNPQDIDQDYGDDDGVFETSDMDAFYLDKRGWRPVASGPADAEAMYYPYPTDWYYHRGDPRPSVGYHAALRKTCTCGAGKWIMFESKCGQEVRMEHLWDQLNGAVYGAPTRFYR